MIKLYSSITIVLCMTYHTQFIYTHFIIIFDSYHGEFINLQKSMSSSSNTDIYENKAYHFRVIWLELLVHLPLSYPGKKLRRIFWSVWLTGSLLSFPKSNRHIGQLYTSALNDLPRHTWNIPHNTYNTSQVNYSLLTEHAHEIENRTSDISLIGHARKLCETMQLLFKFNKFQLWVDD